MPPLKATRKLSYVKSQERANTAQGYVTRMYTVDFRSNDEGLREGEKIRALRQLGVKHKYRNTTQSLSFWKTQPGRDKVAS